MDASPQSALKPDSAFSTPAKTSDTLATELARLWERFLPVIRERAELMSAAAASYASASLTEAQRDTAHSAAHKLAGTLGTFSIARGTELARELELAFASHVAPDPDLARHLASVAAELRTMIDSHK